MEKRRLYLSPYLLTCIFLLTISCPAFADSADNSKITGTYYAPKTGELIMKFGDLSPAQSLRYIALQGSIVKESNYSSPYYTYNLKSYINKSGQTLRNEMTYKYSYSLPQYQYSYSADYSGITDYYYYSNGKIQSYQGSGAVKGEYKYKSYYYSYDYSYDYAYNYRQDGKPSDGKYQYYDKNGKLQSKYDYNYEYYENGKYKSISSTGSGYNTTTGQKTYTYEYTSNYDSNGKWVGYYYVYKDGNGKIIYEYRYP